MEAKILDACSRLTIRKTTQQIVDEYVLSDQVRETLIKSRLGVPTTAIKQRKLITISIQTGITWQDLVYYLVVIRKIPSNRLVSDLITDRTQFERDFLISCESLRWRKESRNR